MIFDKVRHLEVDLIICCGDFQAVRNKHDLSCMTCPPKYREMGAFYKYYSGELKTDIPMLVIGGNHEASNHFFELRYGGWLAPNIYYLGLSGVIKFGGLRIAGMSGIFKPNDFDKGFCEICPLNKNDTYSLYHVRRFTTWQMSQLHSSGEIDIFLTHDWPTCIWKYGNWRQLLRYKKHLTNDMKSGRLGNPSANHLLFQLQPRFWFSGHLHVELYASPLKLIPFFLRKIA